MVGYVAPERIVSVWPEEDLLSSDEYLSLTHSSVEKQYVPASVECPCCHIQLAPVCAFAFIWQSSGSSGLDGSRFFSVLDDCNVLQVVGSVERPVDGPVVRDIHLLPAVGRP